MGSVYGDVIGIVSLIAEFDFNSAIIDTFAGGDSKGKSRTGRDVSMRKTGIVDDDVEVVDR
jgi:hypothetical protein